MAEIKKLKINGVTYDLGGGGSGFDIHSLMAENAIADADELPFYDASAAAPRKTTWSNLKAKLKSYFDTLYLGTTALVGYATQVWVQSQGYGTYSKPSGGIPKTDLASAVQTSLGRADTALQSVPNTYRTAAAQDEIDNGKVDKVSGKGLSTNDYTDADKAKVATAVQPSDLLTSKIDLSPTDAYEEDYNTQKDVNNHLHSKEAEWDAKLDASDLADYALKTDLDELQTKTIIDTAGYFTTDTVEGALAEIGGTLNGLEAAINTIRGIS